MVEEMKLTLIMLGFEDVVNEPLCFRWDSTLNESKWPAEYVIEDYYPSRGLFIDGNYTQGTLNDHYLCIWTAGEHWFFKFETEVRSLLMEEGDGLERFCEQLAVALSK